MFINLLSSADWTLSEPAAETNPGGSTPSRLARSTCFQWKLRSANKQSILQSFMPSRHNTIVKVTPGGTNFFPLARQWTRWLNSSLLNCHLLNVFLSATWPLRSWPSCQDPIWILHAPVIYTYVEFVFETRCEWMAWREVLFTSLHDLFKTLRADAPVGWLNHGWHPQPMCLLPLRSHLRHSVLQKSNASLKSCISVKDSQILPGLHRVCVGQLGSICLSDGWK